MDRATQQRIMRQDQERRDARDIADYLALHHAPEPHHPNAMLVRADARAIGAVTALGAPQRTPPRETCAEVFADSDGNVVYVPGAVKVTAADGSVSYMPASHFRKVRETRQHQKKNRPIVVPEVMRLTRSQSDIAHIQALADGTA
jgi:hypothetical protein